MTITKPLLAVAADLTKLKFPLLASPKLDGIRAIKVNGKLLSRKFKPIPNSHVREMLEDALPDGVDGELIKVNGTFNDCQSAFMSQRGEPNFCYHMFDYVSSELTEPFHARYFKLLEVIKKITDSDVFLRDILVVVEQKYINNMEELMAYEEKCVAAGYEGIMVRTLTGPYKCGRSTLREAFLLKIKRWTDSEGVIVAIEEQMRNDNEKEVDELGHSKRSHHQAGMVAANTLGRFTIKEIGTDIELGVGTGLGLTHELRQEIWDNREKYIGKIITFKWQASGSKDAPRFPIFKGFRHENDLGGE